MTFRFTGLLLRFVGYQRTAEITAVNLADALRQLHERFPQLRPVLWDESGNLIRVHRLLLNGELVSKPDGELPLRDTDQIEVLTAIAGG
ncbi:MoaD/ThiS family protein [Lentzea sp. BCCO 10_0798]|uniref:MoaD/ThiS family protein n=1 Tax=Lentzea kristufekii TaxID=3095430 RepID=A0ABU4TYZ8_9PSEU|nr:MoaD/ThiS family protein [Lentzea sp. BCCO 10_0798]MDX8053543.1 MoaD/ThiS family protein [Lentzea sp. BCCO 10_0798]